MIAHALPAFVVGVTLLTAAGFKLADRTATALAAGTFGLSGRPARRIWLPLAALEATLVAGDPLRARDGKPIDDLGRLVNADGAPIGEDGAPLLDPDGRVLPPARRRRICNAAGKGTTTVILSLPRRT